jgi:hypothetical protein
MSLGVIAAVDANRERHRITRSVVLYCPEG